MASSPLPGGSRHVGRVIDPAVREDGDPDPALELVDEPPVIPSGADTALRAAAPVVPAKDGATAAELGDLDQIGLPEGEPALRQEISAPIARAPSAPLSRGGLGQLSPNLVALFGTLLGFATVASLIALAMNVDVEVPALVPRPAVVSPTPSSVAPKPPEVAAPVPRRARQKEPGPWRIADAKGDAGMRLLEGKIGTDAFLKALEKAGIPSRETYRILASMRGVRDFDRCKKSDRFGVLVDRGSQRVKAFEYVVGPGEVYQSREGPDGLLKGTKLDLKLARNQVSGVVVHDGRSFDASAERSGFDPGLYKVVAKALDGHLDLAELEQGDRVRVIAQETTVLGEFGGYAGVEAVEVRPLDSTRAPLRVYYLELPNERGYYDGDGRSPYEGGWRKPVKDAPMTSPFNMKRLHPILKKVIPHLGIDFGAPTGTPVGASSFGTVTFVGYAGPSGNLVKVEHANGIETGYAHLSRFAEGLKVGDRVKRMQLVGYIGSTGRSTGPHLHFTATRNKQFFDPETLNLDAMRVVSKENRAAFAALKGKYDAALDALPLPELPRPVAGATPAAAPNAPASVASAAAAATDPAESDEEEVAPPSPPPAAPAPPQPAANANGKSVVHLTDQELLQLQGSVDDGEVAD